MVRKLIQANEDALNEVKKTKESTTLIELNNLELQKLELNSFDDLKKWEDAKLNHDLGLDELKNLENNCKNLEENVKVLKSQAKWIQKNAKNSKDSIEFDEKMRQDVQDQCPSTLPEAKASLQVLKQRLEKLPEISFKEIHQIQELEERFDSQKKEIIRLKKEVKDLKLDLEQNQVKLVQGIQEMIENINLGFRDLMSKMGFAGEVILKKGQHDLDFKNYGLEIHVKFRPGDDLQPLSHSVQSGGEKSVTTALYMMALQELTQVPFR